VAWGTKVDMLSRIDPAGKLLSTAAYGDILSREQRKELGLYESYGNFGQLEWTALGLTSILNGLDESSQRICVGVLIDQKDKSAKGLPGFLVGSDGIMYSYPLVKKQGDIGALRMVGKTVKGQYHREVALKYGSRGSAAALSGKPSFLGMRTTPDGGFVAEGNALLKERFPLAKGAGTGLEEILWIFDKDGNLKQEWRVLASPFGHRYQEISVQPDGNVYQLRYSDTGIDVLKYGQ
jgi:hypothetical protein